MTSYHVAAVEWPNGWDPQSPLDAPGQINPVRPSGIGPAMAQRIADATARGLNRQAMEHRPSRWYVVVESDG